MKYDSEYLRNDSNILTSGGVWSFYGYGTYIKSILVKMSVCFQSKRFAPYKKKEMEKRDQQ